MAECAWRDPRRNENQAGGHPSRRDQIPGVQCQLAEVEKSVVGLCPCGTALQKPAETPGQREGTAQPLDDGQTRRGYHRPVEPEAERVGGVLPLWEPFARVRQAGIFPPKQPAALAVETPWQASGQTPKILQ